jgi:hypothetical protein
MKKKWQKIVSQKFFLKILAHNDTILQGIPKKILQF